ncbi:MAG: SAF domain-containing protein [Clostridiales bacterium]|nr:SAF domain-containing protein [Clostridiales bacterium]
MRRRSTARWNARRSLVMTCAIAAGSRITRDMLTFKRPDTGIPPERMEKVIGMVLRRDVDEDTILTEEIVAWR